MSMPSFKKTAAIVLLAGLLAAPQVFAADKTPPKEKPVETAAPAAPPALTRPEIEKIVRDYIMAHPGDILDAVQGYQDKSVHDRQQQAAKASHDDLYKQGESPEAGNPNGDVTLVEFFDYNCGYCKKVAADIAQLISSDKNLRVVFKDFPILGPSSETAAKWALAADKQHKYLAFNLAMMRNHSPITDDLLEQNAKLVGMDVAKAKTDMEGTDFIIQLERNRALAAKLEIHGTPAFVVGEDLAPGAISVDEMKKMIAKVRTAKAKPADKTEGPATKTE